jgi:alkanesulfonate monooxygenase SsuD/methylene tetrahydromethanopterin reductase-like flavin-dependent oxidoreductase (luciferase family)
MDVSMGLPTLLPHGREEEIAWYRGVDEGPWLSLSTLDRLAFPSWALTVQLAAAAAVTERVRLWTDVAVLPARNAVSFAKELATIDVLSGGRLTIGVGIGGHAEDFRAVGSGLSQRFQRLDRDVAAMRDVWAQVPPVTGHLPVGPEPLQPGGPPFVAGVAGPKALARAARWATGVSYPNAIYHVDAEAIDAQRARVIDAWEVAGRETKPHFSACTWFALGPNAKEQLRDHVWDFMQVFGLDLARSMADNAQGHGPAALRAAVAAGRDGGLDELFLVPTTADPTELDRAREALGV